MRVTFPEKGRQYVSSKHTDRGNRSAGLGDTALRIAQTDAEQVYRDLSRYRIVLALEADGWHVDYQLKSPPPSAAARTISLTPSPAPLRPSGMSSNPATLVTGLGIANLEWTKSLGAVGLVRKPIDVDQLKDSLARVFGSGADL